MNGRMEDGQRSPVSISDFGTTVKTGRWDLQEKLMFLYGLSRFGKGRWKKIQLYVPGRSLVQIKSHAQKQMKKINSGVNLFQPLQEHQEKLKVLVLEAERRIEEQEAQPKNKKKKRKRKPHTPSDIRSLPSPWELIHGQSEDGQSDDTASVPSSPTSSAADPPGVHASQQYDEAVRLPATKEHTTINDCSPDGSGAVIAAVAALCQLSARTDP